MNPSTSVTIRAACLALLAPALAGCGSVLTIAPVITEAEAERDPGLLGRWLADDDTEIAIRAGEGNAYIIEYSPAAGGESGASDDLSPAPARFEGYLGHLGTRLVLDVRPLFTAPEPYDALMIPGHLLFVIDAIDGDRLEVRTLEIEAVMTRLRRGELALPYTVQPATGEPGEEDSAPERLLLHGRTGDLRAALERHLGSPGIFAAPDTLKRLLGEQERRRDGP
jgi:hypothetical protein